MFGEPEYEPQSESTVFRPRSMYGISKVACHHHLSHLRRSQSLFHVTGFLYNHESPRRPPTFVTQKIVTQAVQIKYKQRKTLFLGNLEAQRDWGWAPDYVRAMWMTLQTTQPSDYIIASGETHTVREFVSKVFQCLDLKYQDFVSLDPQYFRPDEAVTLRGNPEKIERLGWSRTLSFDQIIQEMVKTQIDSLLSP